jgi:hypothetical protein
MSSGRQPLVNVSQPRYKFGRDLRDGDAVVKGSRLGVILAALTLGMAVSTVAQSAALAETTGPQPLSPRERALRNEQRKFRALAPELGVRDAVEHDTQRIDGATWSVVTFPHVKGGFTCGGVRNSKLPVQGGDAGMDVNCPKTSKLFSAGPAQISEGWLGGSSGIEYVWGWLAPGVKSLEIELSNCHVVRIRVVKIDATKSVFMYVAPSQTVASGVSPVAVIAKGSDGSTIKKTQIGQLETGQKRSKLTTTSCAT